MAAGRRRRNHVDGPGARVAARARTNSPDGATSSGRRHRGDAATAGGGV